MSMWSWEIWVSSIKIWSGKKQTPLENKMFTIAINQHPAIAGIYIGSCDLAWTEQNRKEGSLDHFICCKIEVGIANNHKLNRINW